MSLSIPALSLSLTSSLAKALAKLAGFCAWLWLCPKMPLFIGLLLLLVPEVRLGLLEVDDFMGEAELEELLPGEDWVKALYLELWRSSGGQGLWLVIDLFLYCLNCLF